jgi:hypothetical protein
LRRRWGMGCRNNPLLVVHLHFVENGGLFRKAQSWPSPISYLNSCCPKSCPCSIRGV